MYVTRPLSLFRRSPEALSLPPPEGPSSGYLVLHDDDSQNFCCFGICKDSQLYELPFPQNMDLTIRYTEGSCESWTTYLDPVMLVPVLGQPLSSNRYYAIQRRGKRKGQAHATSTDEDKGTCLCFRYVRDLKPAPLDPTSINQQFEIYARENACGGFGGFSAKSVLPDGHPPAFLRRKGWTISAKTPRTYELEDAEGVDLSLRKRLPGFEFPADRKRSDAAVVGKWYCPFMFIKDGDVSDQIKSSRYYKMTLEQQWVQVLEVENEGRERREAVVVDVGVEAEEVMVGRMGGRGRPGYVGEGVVWLEGEGGRVGLSEGIVERMRWEERRVGCEGSKEGGGVMRLRKEEVFTGGGGEGWVRFGMYVLVERFVLVRMDGSFVMSYEFRHLHHSRPKWDFAHLF